MRVRLRDRLAKQVTTLCPHSTHRGNHQWKRHTGNVALEGSSHTGTDNRGGATTRSRRLTCSQGSHLHSSDSSVDSRVLEKLSPQRCCLLGENPTESAECGLPGGAKTSPHTGHFRTPEHTDFWAKHFHGKRHPGQRRNLHRQGRHVRCIDRVTPGATTRGHPTSGVCHPRKESTAILRNTGLILLCCILLIDL